MESITREFSQGLFCSLKNTRCSAEVWSKATYKNELSLKNSMIVWALPRGPT